VKNQTGITTQQTGTEQKKTPEPSLEEQWQELLAYLEKCEGRPLTEQEKHLSKAQAMDFGEIAY
jgi:hypothetical protein